MSNLKPAIITELKHGDYVLCINTFYSSPNTILFTKGKMYKINNYLVNKQSIGIETDIGSIYTINYSDYITHWFKHTFACHYTLPLLKLEY